LWRKEVDGGGKRRMMTTMRKSGKRREGQRKAEMKGKRRDIDVWRG